VICGLFLKLMALGSGVPRLRAPRFSGCPRLCQALLSPALRDRSDDLQIAGLVAYTDAKTGWKINKSFSVTRSQFKVRAGEN